MHTIFERTITILKKMCLEALFVGTMLLSDALLTYSMYTLGGSNYRLKRLHVVLWHASVPFLPHSLPVSDIVLT